jgi:phosphoenolpyruvate---glycerone phosphotransferase subunit DhaK
MKKLINTVENVVNESLAGFCAAHSDIVRMGEQAPFVQRRHLALGKVALVSGGGSGHEPLHGGFVGHGMLDAACPGQIFTSPTPDLILAAAETADTGGGVLFIVKNYEGDVMNFDMAREMSGKPIATVITDDDVAVEKSTFSIGRRGVAGTLIVEKIVGAAAEEGRGLAALKTLGDRVNAATRSIGIALTSCTVPAAGKPTFDIAEDEMEVGVGIHGEPGRKRVKLRPAAEIAAEMVNAITADLGEHARGEIILLINGFGATPLSELYLMYDAVRKPLEVAGSIVARSLVGNFVTSLDMAGCSVTVSILDEESKRLWDAPVHTPALRWGM